MRSARRTVAVTLGLLALSACSVFFDPDSLRGRADAGTGADASATDAGGADATGDGGLPQEAGSPCSSPQGTVVFCCDFDDGGICGLSLQDVLGTIGVATDGGRSAPASLRSAVQAYSGNAGSTGAYARGVLAVATYGSVRLRFALFIEQAGTAKSKLADVSFLVGSRESGVALELLSSGDFDLEARVDQAADAGGGTDYDKVVGSQVAAPIGQWVPVEITVNPTTRRVTFVVAGTTLVNDGALPAAFFKANPRFEVGFHYVTNPSGARAARFDDVTFELLP